MIKQIVLILTIQILVARVYAQNHKPDNTEPMYGNVEKNSWYKKSDNDFIESVLEQYSNRDTACLAYINLAWSYLFKGDVTTAIKRFNQAWLLDSNNCHVYYGFYAFKMLRNNETEANKYFKMGQQYDTNNVWALRTMDLLTSLYAEQQQNEKIYEMCFKMIKLDSSFVEPYRTLGYYYDNDKQDSSNAIKYYNLAISMNPSDTVTLINRGCYYQSLKKYEKAMEDFERVILMYRNYLDGCTGNCLKGYANRGVLHIDMKNYDLAIKDFEFILSVVPDNEKGSFYRLSGITKIIMNDRKIGCEYLGYAKQYGDNFLGKKTLKKLIREYCK